MDGDEESAATGGRAGDSRAEEYMVWPLAGWPWWKPFGSEG